MARRGRRRKTGIREANGQLQRPTLAQMVAARVEAADAEKAVVLAQPHRRGDKSYLRGSALGRFVDDHKLRIELYDAGNKYGALKNKWLAAIRAPRDVRMGGSGRDVAMEVVNAWGVEIFEMELAIMRAGVAAVGLVEDLSVFDSGEPVGEQIQFAARGLVCLAIHCGYLPARALTG